MPLWRNIIFEACERAGVYGLIIPDLPFELGQQLKEQAHKYNVKLISLIAMTTSEERMKLIAKMQKVLFIP